jgi:hypothetical protein
MKVYLLCAWKGRPQKFATRACGVAPFGPEGMHLLIYFRAGPLVDVRGGCMLSGPLQSG